MVLTAHIRQGHHHWDIPPPDDNGFRPFGGDLRRAYALHCAPRPVHTQGADPLQRRHLGGGHGDLQRAPSRPVPGPLGQPPGGGHAEVRRPGRGGAGGPCGPPEAARDAGRHRHPRRLHPHRRVHQAPGERRRSDEGVADGEAAPAPGGGGAQRQLLRVRPRGGGDEGRPRVAHGAVRATGEEGAHPRRGRPPTVQARGPDTLAPGRRPLRRLLRRFRAPALQRRDAH
mmetsp:Transcript_9180/g.25811  ORF Transcript_9180/g.25811 Transcript_9180/m.25811 type:complete len:228 (-) Transcript_9180:311-994(-)